MVNDAKPDGRLVQGRQNVRDSEEVDVNPLDSGVRGADLVRSSRDGDQFHYTWAARQSLKLLDPAASLSRIYIEGASPDDAFRRTGEETIDVSEYWGGDSLATAERIVYRQLKHSTRRADRAFTASDLSGTVAGFASWYLSAISRYPESGSRISFEIVSNRGCSESFRAAIQWLSDPSGTPPNSSVGTLRDALPEGLSGSVAASFFKLLTIDDAAPNLLNQRLLLEKDLGSMLAGFVGDQPLLLREAVAFRATSLPGAGEPLTRAHVLAALRVTEQELFPAPCRMSPPPTVVVTNQIRGICDQIAASAAGRFLVHASAGIGKSALAHAMRSQLPEGSVVVAYDCFGNGDYRRPSGARHEPHQGVIQIVNELAAQRLCDPLIPNPHATPAQYVKALLRRIEEAAQSLSASRPGAVLVIYIDAADNAVMAAQEVNTTAFVSGLLREDAPDSARLILSCRTERRQLLDIPRSVTQIEMRGFSLDETTTHVRSLLFSGRQSEGNIEESREQDLQTFHDVTRGNPRAQVATLRGAANLPEALNAFSRTPGSSSDPLDDLLRRSVDAAAELSRYSEAETTRICRALAGLRPMIPVAVMARVSDVDASAIRSFIADVGRGLLIDKDAIQFIDEPTETWFRENYRPRDGDLAQFIDRLRPLASEYSYIAASIPALMWEAGQFDDLVLLALGNDALPTSTRGSSLVESTEIARQRALFALKGALTLGRDLDAARLAIRLGRLSAGNKRQVDLLRTNPDLTGLLTEPSVQEQLIASRSLAGEWPSSNLVPEATLLAHMANSQSAGRLRWQSAVTAAKGWARLQRETDGQEFDRRSGISVEDVAELSWARLQLDGSAEGATHLGLWRPKEVRFRAGLLVCRRLVDHGLWSELADFAARRKGLSWLPMAVAAASWESNQIMTEGTTREAVRAIARRDGRLSLRGDISLEEDVLLSGVLWTVACALRHRIMGNQAAADILRSYLPQDLGHRCGQWHERGTTTLLFGFALLALAEGQPFDPSQVAGKDARVDPAKPHVQARDLDSFRANVVPIAAIVNALAGLVVDPEATTDEDDLVAWAEHVSRRGYDAERTSFLRRDGSLMLGRVLGIRGIADARVSEFVALRSARGDEMAWPNTTTIVRWFARTPALVDEAAHLARALSERVIGSADQAEAKIECLVSLARAVLPIGRDEARGFFGDAVAVSERIGEDAYDRWELLCRIARLTSRDTGVAWSRSSALAAVCEGLQPLLHEGPDEGLTLQVIGALSPESAISVASQWRDRRRIPMRSVARVMLADGPHDAAVLRDHPRLGLALLPFSSDLDVPALLSRAARNEPALARHMIAATTLSCHSRTFSAGGLRRLADGLRDLGVDLSGTPFAPDPSRVDPLGAPPLDDRESASRDWWDDPAESAEGDDWLASIDFSTAQGWRQARRRPRLERYVSLEKVAERALSAPASRQARVLRALAETTPGAHELSAVAKVADGVRLTRGGQDALADLAQQVFENAARSILLVRYDAVDIAGLRRTTNCRVDFVRAGLDALGRDPGVYTAAEAFALAGHVAARLDPAQCDGVFDDCLGLFDELHVGTQAAVATPPPESPDACVAGLLWGALGDASIKTRWQAAHSVVILCGLGCTEALDSLHALALGHATPHHFHAPDLEFYRDHANQWLLLAVARAAHDSTSRAGASRFAPFLKEQLSSQTPNIAFRAAAIDGLKELHREGLLSLDDSEEEMLRTCLEPQVVVERDRYSDPVHSVKSLDGLDRLAERIANGKPPKRKHNRGRRSVGGMILSDFVEYWCGPLGEAFGLDPNSVWKLVKEVRMAAGAPPRGAVDERQRQRMYPRDSYLYKSSRAEEDDLDFYYDVHALYVVAARLLRALPVVRDWELKLNSTRTLFDDFLARHTPQRSDGRWLADRRDPVPPTATRALRTQQQRRREWRDSIGRRELSSALRPSAGWLVVGEAQFESGRSRRQLTRILSVLAPPQTAAALLRAMQTAPRFLGLPSAQGQRPGDLPSQYRVAEWVLPPDGSERSLDSHDALAGGVEFPPFRPAEWVAEALAISPDPDMRHWRDPRGEDLFWSWSWADRKGASGKASSEGQRLAIAEEHLPETLTALDRYLLVSVTIDRYEKVYGRGDSGEREKHGRQFHRYYLFDIEGRRHTL